MGRLVSRGQTNRCPSPPSNAATGAQRVFDQASGPGVWPPVTIGGERYFDDGMRSGTHANLAAGKQRVVGTKLMPSPSAHADALKQGGAAVAVVTPDARAKSAQVRSVSSRPSRQSGASPHARTALPSVSRPPRATAASAQATSAPHLKEHPRRALLSQTLGRVAHVAHRQPQPSLPGQRAP